MFKVMIADDESIIRKGLINLIDWNALDCEVIFEACNGMVARDNLEAAKPDIVITDVKMPRLNGIELSEYIHKNHPNVKVIILTAYADFLYAQSAIKYDVVDFIIKTDDPIENVRQAVLKAKDQIVGKKEKEKELTRNKTEVREKFLQDVINGVISDTYTINDRMLMLEIQLSKYHLLFFEIDSSSNSASSPEEQKQFNQSIRNFLTLAFKDYQYYIVFTGRQSFCLLLQFRYNTPSEALHSIMDTCREIISMVESFMNFKINIGVSKPHINPEEIPMAYSEALKALSGCFYNDNLCVFIYGASGDPLPENLQETGYIDSIIRFVKEGKGENAIAILNELLERQKISKQPVERIKNTAILLCSLCSKLLSDYNLELIDIKICSGDIYNELLTSRSINKLSEILNTMVSTVSSSLSSSERKSNSLINKSMQYIKENYKNQISLQQIADYIHVNSSYLSRLFSKETGNTVTDIINNLKIEKAKEILLNTSLKIFEVANEVGIEDSTYFIRLFKKHTGQSPKEYRHPE